MTALPFPGRFTLAFVVAAFAMLTLGLIVPRPSYSQGPPLPAVFFGDVADITVNGEPYDGVTPIEAIDENGDVVGTADVSDEGIWLIQVPLAESVRFRIGGAISAAEPFVPGSLSELTIVLSGIPTELPTRSLELSAGFQALTHVGEDLSIDDFLALFDEPAAVAGIFLWDAGALGYAVWRLGLPAPLQGITEILQNAPMLLLLETDAVYTSDVLAHEAGAWPLVNGFAGIAYLGADDDPIAAALNDVDTPDSVSAIFRFNNTIRNWDSYNRGLPPSLNSLREIQRWDFLLVRAELPTSWTYDEFLP